MGNRWEEIERRCVGNVRCPCGNGAYEDYNITLQDDYGRTRDEYKSYITCPGCYSTYIYSSHYGWLLRTDNEKYKVIRSRNDLTKQEIRHELIEKYYPRIMRCLESMKTKKAQYELLTRSRAVYVPGTVETFRKHLNQYGLGSVVDKRYLNSDKVIKLVRDLGIPMDDQDTVMIRKLAEMRTEETDFLKSHCFKSE